MSAPAESFRPRAHWLPDTPLRRVFYELRLLGDLQTCSIRRDLAAALTGASGQLLDVGCGNGPFRHLLDPAKISYQGVDVAEAAAFGYANPGVVYFDGHTLPFPDASFEFVLCTEVLEHIPDPTETIREMHRVLKPGGRLLLTIPWSARFHYQPHDYHRYTPSMLCRLFVAFAGVEIKPRGTDLSSIASKFVVLCARQVLGLLSPAGAADWITWPLRLLALLLLLLPVLPWVLLLGHAGIRWGWGSADDPLGYTVVARK